MGKYGGGRRAKQTKKLKATRENNIGYDTKIKTGHGIRLAVLFPSSLFIFIFGFATLYSSCRFLPLVSD